MEAELILEGGHPIGYKLIPTNKKDHETIGVIRDLHFFGHDDTYLRYAGLELIVGSIGKVHGNIRSLSFKQEKFTESHTQGTPEVDAKSHKNLPWYKRLWWRFS